MKEAKVSALMLAKYFVHLSQKTERKLTNKKLQKLLYYSQAWSLAITGKPIFSDVIKAWIHGPVIPTIYHKYKKHGFEEINEVVTDNFSALNSFLEILDDVWQVYGKYDADYLELLTHNEDPWIHARHDVHPHKASKPISHASMRTFYTAMLNKLKRDYEKQ